MTTHPSYSQSQHDPDILAEGEESGFEYLVAHNGIGYRCGYVRIPRSHPWYGRDYDHITAEVHGGLTYGERGTDGSWWVGFDCAHSGDAPDPTLKAPTYTSHATNDTDTIRTTDYVRAECVSLCKQAAAVAKAAEETRN